MAVRLVDISVGGVCLALPAQIPLELGGTMQGCSLELPALGTLRFGLQFLNRLDQGQEGDEKLIGCRFVDMDLRHQMLLQRFLHQLQVSARAEAAAI